MRTHHNRQTENVVETHLVTSSFALRDDVLLLQNHVMESKAGWIIQHYVCAYIHTFESKLPSLREKS
jgi:hypothetical protein